MSDEQEVGQSVIIDNGSWSIKAGLSGEEPTSIFRSTIGRSKLKSGFDKDVFYIGKEAVSKREELNLEYPIQRGQVISDSIVSVDLGGRQVSDHLSKYYEGKHRSMDSEIITSIKEKRAFVAGDYDILMKQYEENVFSASGNEATFLFINQIGDTYNYMVPPPPATDSKKRPVTVTYTFKLFFGLNEFYSDTAFSYSEPTISGFQPFEMQVLQSGGRPTFIEGESLLLADGEPFPQVFFGAVAANVLTVKGNMIKVNVPDSLVANNVDVVIIFYNGLRIVSPFQFAYVVPRLTSVAPTAGISGNSIDLTLTVPVDVMEGTNIELDVTMTIGMIVQSNVKFNIYYPRILTVTPDSGLATGNTDVRVTGNYLAAVTSATIGGQDCVIDPITVTDDEFSCVTSPIVLGFGNNHESYILQATVEGMVIQAPVTQPFTYFMPVITDIQPPILMSKGVQKITINGFNFGSIDKINVGATSHTVLSIANTANMLLVDVDVAAGYVVGDVPVTVFIGSSASNIVNIKIVEPKIKVPVAPATGFRFAEHQIIISTENFPVIPNTITADDLRKNLQFKVGGLECTNLLKIINQEQLTCLVPMGAANVATDITFTLFAQDYTTDKQFTYFEPTFTNQVQTTTIPRGGGKLEMDGTDLTVIDKITIDTHTMDMSTCTLTAVRIECDIPPMRPGAYDLTFFANGHSYLSPTKMDYIGPAVDKISPHQGNRQRNTQVTITGLNFGLDDTKVAVTINGLACTNIDILLGGPDEEITCEKPIDVKGVHIVVLSVDPGTGVFIEAMDHIEFINHGLSCMGRAEADGSNPAVNWGLTYKLKGASASSKYLYQDNTMDSLIFDTGLSNVDEGPYSPLAATFDQYKDYYYMFFNDQPGSRGSNGERSNKKSESHHKHGHLKGMVFFEDDGFGGYQGIHIMHSNPHFPAYRGANTKKYYQIDDGIYWLGAPDYNQHFFCYPFANLDSVAEYFFKNDGNLLDTYDIPDMSLWTDAKKNLYPHLYDMIQTEYDDDDDLDDRVPGMGDLAIMTSANFKATCQAAVPNTPVLEDICYWKSPTFTIDGRTAQYFMKTEVDRPNAGFPAVAAIRPATLNRFIIANHNIRVPIYEGVDLWHVVADHYQRKMFVEFFYAIAMKQAEVMEELSNVGIIHIAPNLATAAPPNVHGHIVYSDFEYSGKKNEHAKMGWPMYPVMDDANMNNADENMFCVGDSNRHNGQGNRAGGILCFQHPGLAYQFNRMVHRYNTHNAAGLIHPPASAMNLFTAISQPIKLTRGTWDKDVIVEVKDIIGGLHTKQVPRNIHTVDATTLPNVHDITPAFSALRTTHVAANVGVEQTLVNIPPLLPGQADIMTYVADDTFSLHYTSFSDKIAVVCDFDPTFLTGAKCTKDMARTTQLTETGLLAVPVFPAVYAVGYGEYQPLRTFDLTAHLDFQLIKAADEFREKLSLTPDDLDMFQFVVDASVVNPYFLPPFIIRPTNAICTDELSYYSLLSYAFSESKAVDGTTIIFKIGNTDVPNWANAALFAISKKIYNSIAPIIGKSSAVDVCFTTFPAGILSLPDFTTYIETASAVWDLMDETHFSDGKGGRILRTTTDDVISWKPLLDIIISLKPTDNVNSLFELIDRYYAVTVKTAITNQLFINRYLIEPPKIVTVPIITVFRSFSVHSAPAPEKIPTIEEFGPVDAPPLLVTDPDQIVSPIRQLLKDSPTFDPQLVIALTDDEIERLDQSLNKWITISGVNQGLQVLLRDPMLQTNDQPIKFIDEINRDTIGSVIDLCYNKLATATFIQVCTPMSIVALTFFLESAIASDNTPIATHGDIDYYLVNKPYGYSGYITEYYQGMIIATMNSQLCDIAMVSSDTILSENFDNICQRAGPQISWIDGTAGSTIGGNVTDIHGYGFFQGVYIRFGPHFCGSLSTTSNLISCIVPDGAGANVPIFLYKYQSALYNLQRTRFTYSYDRPYVTSIEPLTIDSNGGTITIEGDNYGYDASRVSVIIDGELTCYVTICRHQSIECSVPVGTGPFHTVQVTVAGQTSTFSSDISYNYEEQLISKFNPASGDPGDLIAISGDGFGDPETDDKPILQFD
eukprot:gene14814-17516_t